jgi:hypothetical protein
MFLNILVSDFNEVLSLSHDRSYLIPNLCDFVWDFFWVLTDEHLNSFDSLKKIFFWGKTLPNFITTGLVEWSDWIIKETPYEMKFFRQ